MTGSANSARQAVDQFARIAPGQRFQLGHEAPARHVRGGSGLRQHDRIERRGGHDMSPARSKIGMYSSTTMAPTTRPMAAIRSGSKVRVKRSIQRPISPS